MSPRVFAVSCQEDFVAIFQHYYVDVLVVRIVFYDENRRSVIARPIQPISLSHATTFRHPSELSTGEISGRRRTLWPLGMESAHPKGEPRKVPPPAKNRVSILLDDEVLASSRCVFPASVARMYENVLRFHWLGARVACHTFPTVRFDVGKSVAENHRKTANNEAPCAEADRGPKRVSSKLPLQTNTARPKGLRQLSHAGVRRQQGPAPVSEEVV